MKLIIDIPNSLYANLKKIANGSIASKRILDCVKNGTPFENQDSTKINQESNQGDLISREALISEFKRRAVDVRNWKTDALNNSNEESVIRADAVLAYMVEVKAVIDNAPTVDIDMSGYSNRLWKNAYERGRTEARPKGHWGSMGFVGMKYAWCRCSNCHKTTKIYKDSNNDFCCIADIMKKAVACLYCGADMRGEEKNVEDYL